MICLTFSHHTRVCDLENHIWHTQIKISLKKKKILYCSINMPFSPYSLDVFNIHSIFKVCPNWKTSMQVADAVTKHLHLIAILSSRTYLQLVTWTGWHQPRLRSVVAQVIEHHFNGRTGPFPPAENTSDWAHTSFLWRGIFDTMLDDK